MMVGAFGSCNGMLGDASFDPSVASSSSMGSPGRPFHAAPIPSRTQRIQSNSTRQSTMPSAKRALLQLPRGLVLRRASQPLHTVQASVTAGAANTNATGKASQ
jgi:hypothetical protein